MDGNVEKEMCNNCKKEIPQTNYVMHTMHCARNITLCKVCNEPIPKIEYETHREKCRKPAVRRPSPPPVALEKSSYFQQRKETVRNSYGGKSPTYSNYNQGHLIGKSSSSISNISSSSSSASIVNYHHTDNIANKEKPIVPAATTTTTGAIKKPPLIPRLDDVAGPQAPIKGSNKGLLACRYCDLELPKLDLEEHENYCGSRTDKCLECGELVMFKNKQMHMDSNHGFVNKLKENPNPSRPTWDSTTQRGSINNDVEPTSPTRRRLDRVRLADIDYDPMPYLPAAYQPGGGLRKNKEGESYKEISRRLDCTTPEPPRRRRNPPTELTIPCEFCDTPIPHEELIQHETGCRPDLARFNPRRSRTQIPLPDEDDYTPSTYTPYEAPRARSPPRADSPDSEELPCEFCSHMVPASQLWRHQLSCTSAA